MTPKSALRTIRPLLKNPDFIRELRNYLSTLTVQSKKPEEPPRTDNLDYKKISPAIFIDGRSIVCDGRNLDLTFRPKVFNLFCIFLRSSQNFVSRQELLAELYQHTSVTEHSSRLKSSENNNLIKLLSRSRIAAASTFGATRTLGIEWFVYDEKKDGWYLYRISNFYRRQLIKT